MEHSLNLTFGIELEFICVYPRHLFRAFLSDCKEPAEAGNVIYLAMRQQGIPATGFETDEETQRPRPASYARWRVEKDNLILSPAQLAATPRGYVCEPMELISRKFHLDHEDWRAEISKVITVLSDIEALGCRMIANSNTGFHVHVGNSSDFLSFQAVKNVFKLGTAFERCFDLLHTVPRIAVPDSQENWKTPCAPPSYFHRNRGDKKLSERLSSIEAATSFHDIVGMFPIVKLGELEDDPNGHVSAYNFDNMTGNPDFGRHEESLTKTIEFRQHTGTLSFADVEAWILTVTSLVRFANTQHDSAMSVFLATTAEDLNFKVLDLLQTIGVPDHVVWHYGCKLNTECDPAAYDRATTLSAELNRRDYRIFYRLIEAVENERYTARNAAAIRAAVQRKSDAGFYGI